MNLRSWPRMLVAFALALTASVASAGTNDIVLQADGTYYNIATHQRVDVNGNVLGTESDKDRDKQFLWIDAINDTAGAHASCDSTAWMQTGACKTLALKIRVHWPTAAAAAVAAPWNARLLFEVRGAYAASNADSVNWAPWTMNTTSAGADTAVVVQTVLPTGAVAGSTESLVSLTYEPQPISTDTARNPQSLSMAWIVLQNRFGKFWAPYTQVRMRVLSCTAGASLVAPTIHLDVIGSPL